MEAACAAGRDGGWLFEPACTACGGGGRECADPFHDDWPHWDPATPPPLLDLHPPLPPPPPDWWRPAGGCFLQIRRACKDSDQGPLATPLPLPQLHPPYPMSRSRSRASFEATVTVTVSRSRSRADFEVTVTVTGLL
jgi:hypothetical protein